MLLPRVDSNDKLFVGKVTREFIQSLGKMLSKKDNIIVGFAFSYFSGNIKYLYQEMETYSEIEVYFVTPFKEEAEKLKLSGVNVYYYRDLKRIPRLRACAPYACAW